MPTPNCCDKPDLELVHTRRRKCDDAYVRKYRCCNCNTKIVNVPRIRKAHAGVPAVYAENSD